MKKNFNIKDFKENSIIKFYYERGRHTVTSLKTYKGSLYVHKLLGYNYSGVSEREYRLLLESMEKLCDKLKKDTELNLPGTVFLDYSSKFNCIEKIENYSGNSLRFCFPTSSETLRREMTLSILNKIDSLINSNGNEIELKYSIDPTPDNFTFDGQNIYFVDVMPPLVKGKEINPQFLSDKSRTEEDIEKRMFRYLTQKGLYITFLTKFGGADISFFDKLFDITLSKIKHEEVKKYIYNETIKSIEELIRKRSYYFSLNDEIKRQFKVNEEVDRDMIRLISLYFIKKSKLIERNAKKYRVHKVNKFLEDKRCAADIIEGIIYSKYRSYSLLDELKDLVASLIALQYGK